MDVVWFYMLHMDYTNRHISCEAHHDDKGWIEHGYSKAWRQLKTNSRELIFLKYLFSAEFFCRSHFFFWLQAIWWRKPFEECRIIMECRTVCGLIHTIDPISVCERNLMNFKSNTGGSPQTNKQRKEVKDLGKSASQRLKI